MRNRRTITQRGLAALTAAGLAVTLAACSGDDTPEETTAETTTEAAPEPTEEETTPAEEETTDEATAEAPAGDGTTPEWAKPLTTPGELLTTIEGEGFTVDVYEVGTTTSPKDGLFVDPEENNPIIAEGDEIVFVNYVFTNTGAEAIPLSYSLVSVDARYDDWPYLGGMDTITGNDLFEEMGVNTEGVLPGSGDAPFAWEPGTSFSYGENFKYQADSPITFNVTLTPADDAGDLVHDERQELEGSATIS